MAIPATEKTSLIQRDKTLLTAKALPTALSKKLAGKRVVLASSSPRRKRIFEESLGLQPEIVKPTFAEDLPHEEYLDEPGEYCIATATEKALEVYIKLANDSPHDPPSLVIGADTIVVHNGRILEKPSSKDDNLRILLELNATEHQVITGVTIIQPQLATPGYSITSLMEQTLMTFADNERSLLEAYVESGEGLDKAGGYGIQGSGAVLIQRIHGDHNNAVGFPAFAFYHLLSNMLESGELLYDDDD